MNKARVPASITSSEYPYNILDDANNTGRFTDEDLKLMKKMLASQPDPVEYVEQLVREAKSRRHHDKGPEGMRARYFGDALVDVMRMRYKDKMSTKEIYEVIEADPITAIDRIRDTVAMYFWRELKEQRQARKDAELNSSRLLNASLKQIAARPGMTRLGMYTLMKRFEAQGIDTVARWGVTPETAYDVAHHK